MTVSITPAAPGTVAILRAKSTSPNGVAQEYLVAVIAWAITVDEDSDDLQDTHVVPIGVDGKIFGAVRFHHGGK